MHEVADYLTDTYNGPEAYHRNLNASMRPHPSIGEFLDFVFKITGVYFHFFVDCSSPSLSP